MKIIIVVKFGSFLISTLCLVYFILKGYLREGWSRFALVWATVFAFCGVLTIFPPGNIKLVYLAFGFCFFSLTTDFFLVKRKERDRAFTVLCAEVFLLGITFAQFVV